MTYGVQVSLKCDEFKVKAYSQDGEDLKAVEEALIYLLIFKQEF
jgi:hypothetical protein